MVIICDAECATRGKKKVLSFKSIFCEVTLTNAFHFLLVFGKTLIISHNVHRLVKIQGFEKYHLAWYFFAGIGALIRVAQIKCSANI